MIRSGELRERVAIQSPTTATDPQWGPTPTYTTAATVWARVDTVAASERQVQNGVQSTVSHKVTIRYRADVTSKHRLLYRGRVLDIVGVTDPEGRRNELLIECREHPHEGGSDVYRHPQG